VTAAARDSVHGHAGVEQGGFMAPAQVVKAQLGEAALAGLTGKFSA
jgi:hypothetical protein